MRIGIGLRGANPIEREQRVEDFKSDLGRLIDAVQRLGAEEISVELSAYMITSRERNQRSQNATNGVNPR